MGTSDKNRVIIFDTTLRDGEQALQQSLTAKQKLQIALCLEQLGVDVIEAGFPISSPGDLQSVREIGLAVKNSTVCGLSRALDKDIDACYEALHRTERRMEGRRRILGRCRKSESHHRATEEESRRNRSRRI